MYNTLKKISWFFGVWGAICIFNLGKLGIEILQSMSILSHKEYLVSAFIGLAFASASFVFLCIMTWKLNKEMKDDHFGMYKRIGDIEKKIEEK